MDAQSRSDIFLEFLEIPIHVSKHPEVNSYITECLKTARELLYQDGLKQIALIFVTESDVPVEKYCFDLRTPDEGENDSYFVKTEETFRQYLLKLSVADLKNLPDDCSFRIQIKTSESCSVRLSESSEQAHFPWIEAEKETDVEKNAEIIPIKTLETSSLTLNMYMEKCDVSEKNSGDLLSYESF